MSKVTHAIKAFYEFWKDFLIGDCPEVFIGVAVILGIAFLIKRVEVLAAIVIPLAVLLLMTFTLSRGTKE